MLDGSYKYQGIKVELSHVANVHSVYIQGIYPIQSINTFDVGFLQKKTNKQNMKIGKNEDYLGK